MTDAALTREDLREELRALREDLRQELAPMQTQLAALPIIQQELQRLHTEVRALRIETLAHSDVLNTLQDDARMLQAAINDISKENVTAGEMEVVHRDINRLQMDVARLKAAASLEPQR